ncbi:U32 family peptidase, partial [Anabaena sp. CA = ATCC 33047]|uniref:U32 family peptidase n=1 Tax=Anabaena sp. (strain CA / ATCC 33047) TaxID=52271 RepID=UPI001E4820A3
PKTSPSPTTPSLIVLVRNLKQLQTALNAGVETIYCEFEDPRAYREAVRLVDERRAGEQGSRGAGENNFYPIPSPQSPVPTIWVAPPRITKPGENWILQQVRASQADGYLVRNYDQLEFFGADRCIGDFSLNVANPITANYFHQRYGLERLTASYDLNITQLEDLLTTAPPEWFEVTIHQHIPMFHMEHCVFCAFLSEGTDYTNCGRPCEQHEVKLRDRVGSEHILLADTGCRNTVFNGTAQTGAEYVQRLIDLGLRHFRIEFVNETPEQVRKIIHRYQQLLQGEITGSQLWRELKLQNQLGVTRGPLGVATAGIH